MAKHNLLDTSTVNLNDIFVNGRKYKVPLYQRDYSWKEEHWDDLWTDVCVVNQYKNTHYMGAIVLQDHKDKSYSIIDGQQRLATLSILSLAIIKRIQDLIDAESEKKANEDRKALLMNAFIGSRDAVSLHYSSKLFLNETNNSFYQNFLLQLRPPNNPHRLSSSDKLLWQAFQYFYQKINEHFGSEVRGEDLADFIFNQVAENLLFIQIVVEDELDAYTVFETLNARGLELTVTDLLKNYLLALSSKSSIDQQRAKEQWESIIKITDLKAFPKFLRYYWNSRNELTRKDNLFKALKQRVQTQEQSFALLDELERYAGIYAALEDPEDELWQGRQEIAKRVKELQLFRVTQCFPLLLITYFKLPNEFERVLRICSVISFRYNVIAGLNPNIQELSFNRAACRIADGSIANAVQTFQELQDIYPTDEDFAHAFSTKILDTRRNKKLVRYILYKLENQMASTDRSFEDGTSTIEHILPENPSQEWASFFPIEEQLNYIYRLGNYTLLESSKNNDCKNASFADKFLIYQSSQYHMTNSINFLEWTPAQLQSRQRDLARIATSVWRIQLG